MSDPGYYEHGSWKVVCDVCGRFYRAHMLNLRWDGLMVCPDDWEPRQPQDFVRGVADTISPPWTRPEQQDTFIFFCTSITSQGRADYGVADCAMADINNNLAPQCTEAGSMAISGAAVCGCAVSGRLALGLNNYLYNDS